MKLSLMALALAIALSAAPANGAVRPGRVEFQVFRNGAPFGSHIVEVVEQGRTIRVVNQVRFEAKMGAMTVYRFEQTCTEIWRDQALETLECATLRNGRRSRLDVRREGGQLRADAGGATSLFPADMTPTTWWSRVALGARHFMDTRTGREIPLVVRSQGRRAFQVQGRDVQAEHVLVQGTETLHLWYDSLGRWIGCAFAMRGQNIEYRLVSSPGEAPATGRA